MPCPKLLLSFQGKSLNVKIKTSQPNWETNAASKTLNPKHVHLHDLALTFQFQADLLPDLHFQL